MKFELRNRINEDVVIFSHECEGNSIKKTVEEAVKQGISLARANLYKANLSVVNLSWADLTEANLSGANLSGANLRKADLSGAKFSESQKDIILNAIGLVFHEGNDSK